MAAPCLSWPQTLVIQGLGCQCLGLGVSQAAAPSYIVCTLLDSEDMDILDRTSAQHGRCMDAAGPTLAHWQPYAGTSPWFAPPFRISTRIPASCSGMGRASPGIIRTRISNRPQPRNHVQGWSDAVGPQIITNILWSHAPGSMSSDMRQNHVGNYSGLYIIQTRLLHR